MLLPYSNFNQNPRAYNHILIDLDANMARDWEVGLYVLCVLSFVLEHSHSKTHIVNGG